MDLPGKVAIVTGASRGIGRQIALELGRRGVQVVIGARTVQQRRVLPGSLDETIALIEQAGGTATAVQCDVTDPADLEKLVHTAVNNYGGVDILVNNAADMVGGDLETVLQALLGIAPSDPSAANAPSPYEAWSKQFATNVHAPYLLTMLTTPHMRARGAGIVINITSAAGDLIPLKVALATPSGNPSVGYGVTKAALNRLTNALAAQLVADRIAVVAVDPGVVRTEAREILDEHGIPFPFEGAPMEVPVAAVLELLTAPDVIEYSGEIIRAQ